MKDDVDRTGERHDGERGEPVADQRCEARNETEADDAGQHVDAEDVEAEQVREPVEREFARRIAERAAGRIRHRVYVRVRIAAAPEDHQGLVGRLHHVAGAIVAGQAAQVGADDQNGDQNREPGPAFAQECARDPGGGRDERGKMNRIGMLVIAARPDDQKRKRGGNQGDPVDRIQRPRVTGVHGLQTTGCFVTIPAAGTAVTNALSMLASQAPGTGEVVY